jgi:hypothetical protein
MTKIGLSAGIYTTAVYPVAGILYFFKGEIHPDALKCALFLPLCLLAAAIAPLRALAPAREAMPRQIIYGRHVLINAAMVVSIVLFAVLNHLLNSGVLEQNGGTVQAPRVFFVCVMLRLPLGVFLGWLAEKGKCHYSVSMPIAMMAAGGAISLFTGGSALGDLFMLGLFNLGGAGIVMLTHALGMRAVIWRNGNPFAASFGSACGLFQHERFADLS